MVYYTFLVNVCESLLLVFTEIRIPLHEQGGK